MVGGHGEDAEGVGVAEAALPALDGDDGRAGFDDAELEGLTETEPDTVVDLPRKVSAPAVPRESVRTWGLLTSVCHWCASMPRGSGYQNG